MLTLQRTYRFRMNPTRSQEHALYRQDGARRFVWNWALARRKAYYAEHGRGIPAAQLSAELTAMKGVPETAWLKECDSQAIQQTLRDLDKAYVAFFEKRAKFPRFKSRKTDTPRFRIPQRVKVADGKVYIPKVGWVRIRQSQSIEGTSKSATFKRDTMGHWFVTLVVAFTMPDVPLPAPNPENVVGVDAGLKDFLVLSNGEREPAPKFYRKAQRSFARRSGRCAAGRREASDGRRQGSESPACSRRPPTSDKTSCTSKARN